MEHEAVASKQIELRGVAVHNLRNIDLDIPHRQLVALCGVSGSGKTSLALDTLYAEGQRRYIESFSAYTRQFLEKMEKPDADRIDGIPPAVAVTRRQPSQSSRATVGTATETTDYLRLLYAKIASVFCPVCQRPLQKDTPDLAAARLRDLPDGTRFMIAFDCQSGFGDLQEQGFARVIVNQQTAMLADLAADFAGTAAVVVDRLSAGHAAEQRVRESLETAFLAGHGRCAALVETSRADDPGEWVDGKKWSRLEFSRALVCTACQVEMPDPEPRLFSFNSPLGACSHCEGFGNVVEIDMDRVVPDPGRSLREGAIAPWNTPAYEHELQELLALADDYDLPTDVPYAELTDQHLRLIREGVPERDFGGLNGFFAWLEKRKYKMHLRVFLSRWRSYRPCPQCHGARLRPEALAARIGGKNIAEVCALTIRDALDFFIQLELTPWQRQVGHIMLEQVTSRLRYLDEVGVGYLALDRVLKTLSGGEGQRVSLTTALGSSLVNMLYVLDEPSVGLHSRDVERLLKTISGLRNRANTVILVEHEPAMIRAADEVIEIGPGAGQRGGEVVFQGTPAELEQDSQSLTGAFLSGRRGATLPETRRAPNHGWIRLAGARGNNLQNLTVEFPLGVLCVVTGVSGAGKSTLVEGTLYPALCQRKRKENGTGYPYDDVFGDGQVDDIVLIDQSPIGRSPRSNPVTYIKAFDQIRAVFAETTEARTHNYTAGHFSFNVDGGRCTACDGDGYIVIDMNLLADVYMKCSHCHGKRYRREILDVLYRGKNIADVLEMTVREAFSFFRGQTKVQSKLKRLIDVGLDYLRLGQPANTLSSGESQRLKLAAYLSTAKRNRTLFIMDEPTTGLHFADVVQLLDCFDALVNVGHSLIVVEHNLQLIRAADYVIDLGPGAGDQGGRVMAAGTPEQITHQESITGQYLREALAD